jgi:predicted DNA-binding protein (MmcQ/YjbR family)
MDIEDIQNICKELPFVTEDIKWGNDLVFSIGAKMFCVLGLNQSPTTASFKVADDQFGEISMWHGFKPAPYVAKYKWVYTSDINNLKKSDWEKFLRQSYELVKAKLPPKIKKQFTLE